MHGKGVMEWPGGRKYEGEFKDDARDGNGKLTTEDGKIFEGLWSKGKFLPDGSIMQDSELNDQSLASQFN